MVFFLFHNFVKNVFGAFYGRIDWKNILHEELICSLKFECNFGVGLALF